MIIWASARGFDTYMYHKYAKASNERPCGCYGVVRILKKATHIKGRLLYQAMILHNYVPFEMGTSPKGKDLLPEGANSFL